MIDIRQPLQKVRRLVIKLGTAVVTENGSFATLRLRGILEEIHQLRQQGIKILLVSSGAVGLGRHRMKQIEGATLVERQALAAIGQSLLMSLYDQLANQFSITCAQVLLTQDDFLDRSRYLSIANTLDALLNLGCLPIINENDTVSTAELILNAQRIFGDNDKLSALVAAGVDADALVILSNVPGILSHPPQNPLAARIAVFDESTQVDSSEQAQSTSATGRGGIKAKIQASRLAASAGVPTVVASGFETGILQRLLQLEDVGTYFPANPQLTKRQRWLAFATAPACDFILNAGAATALIERGASLLARGIVAISRDFAQGAVVRLKDHTGRAIGLGICRMESSTVRQLMSTANADKQKPAVHRDDMVILADSELVATHAKER